MQNRSMRQTIANHLFSFVGAYWALLGFLLLLIFAVIRISPYAGAIVPIAELSTWVAVITWSIFMVFLEGHRGFQLRFSPYFAERLSQLMMSPRWLQVLLAPVYCGGYFDAPRERLLRSWVLLGGIVALVIFMSFTPQPYRGVVAFGVLAGLIYGALTLLYYNLRAIAAFLNNNR